MNRPLLDLSGSPQVKTWDISYSHSHIHSLVDCRDEKNKQINNYPISSFNKILFVNGVLTNALT